MTDSSTEPLRFSQSTLLELVQGILGNLDLETVLTRVLDAAKELTGAEYAALGVMDPERQRLERFLVVGIDEETKSRIGQLPTGKGVLGELIHHPAPMRLSNVGSHPHSYGFPVNHPRMRTFLGVPISVDGLPYGNLYLTEKAGGVDFTDADEEAVVSLAEYAAVAIKQARRYTKVEDERRALAETVDALRATTEITHAVAGEGHLDVILEMIAKRGRALVNAQTLLIELIDQPDLLFAAVAGASGADLLGQRLGIDGTVADTAIRTRETQRLSEQLNRSRFNQRGAGQLGLEAQDGLIVPMIFRGDACGVLVALDREDGGAFTDSQQRLLESFADSAAMAVGTAQSAADDRQRQRIAATEAERTRWARELHDETLQALAGIRIGLASALKANDAEHLHSAVTTAVEEIRSDIDNLRALIADVRPGALDELGVEPALRDLVRRFDRRGLVVELSCDLGFESGRHSARLIPEQETAIYRTVQEALNNVVKHSSATQATVTVCDADDMVKLSVVDNGAGFDQKQASEGFGLVGMRERISLVGGTLSLTSDRGGGTTVSAAFPAVRERASEERVPEPASSGGAATG